MGAFLDKPITDKEMHCGTAAGLEYGICSMQGWRVDMEDAHVAAEVDKAHAGSAFFGVFDGHGGKFAAEYSSAQIVGALNAEPKFTSSTVAGGLRAAFLAVDAKLARLPRMISGEDLSGTTACTAYVTPEHIFCANAGDSRAILCRGGRAVALSSDHKPENPGERSRILSAGGHVTMSRVNGDLAVSRALGDFNYKNRPDLPADKQMVSPEPDVHMEVRTGEDQFIVIACDGIWDVMTNDEVAGFVLDKVQAYEDLAVVGARLIDHCLERGSRDNMSAVIVRLPGCPPVDPKKAAAAAAADKEAGDAATGPAGRAAASPARRGGGGLPGAVN